jgi:predicted RecB family endonuclease
MKNIQLDLDEAKKRDIGLSDDEKDVDALMATSKLSYNVSSAGAGHAHNTDSVGLTRSVSTVTGNPKRKKTGIMLVHDAFYGSVDDLLEIKPEYEAVGIELARKYDAMNNMVETMLAIVKKMDKAKKKKGADVGTLNEKIKLFNKASRIFIFESA